MSREIVDESDVYVDVHKAIRRLTPAPRARRLHAAATAASVMASKKAPGDSILVDVDEHDASPHREPDAASFHSNYEGGFHNAAKTAIHMKRRTSDGGIEGTPVVVKASLDEMRSQLRLGPANRAANPRSNTRSLFKIKQGLGTSGTPPDSSRPLPPRAQSHMGFTNNHGSPARNQGHERTPLLGVGEDYEEAVEDDETHDGRGHKTNGRH